jgi:large subunit ribosomal protein L9
MDIAEALQAKGYETDRRKIVLKQPIKETGDYTVKVRLHREVLLDVPVHVTAIGGEEATEEQKAEKKTRRGAKTKASGEVESADTTATTAAAAEEAATE